MASNALECDICSHMFSDDHCPRILPCSHSFCSRCINGIIERQNKTCPICRTEFYASSAEDLMINRNLLDVARQISSKASSKEPGKPFLRVTNDFRENSIKVVLADCQQVVNEILDATEILRGMKDDVLETSREAERRIKVMQEVQLSSGRISSNIVKSIEMMNSGMGVILELEEKMQDTDAKLESATDFTSAGIMMDAAEEVLDDVRNVVKDIREHLQKNKRETQDIRKEILNTKERLGSLPDGKGETEENPFIDITVGDLQSSCGSIKGNGQRNIFAVKTLQGRQMVAPVIPRIQVFLDTLQGGGLPSESFVIKHESLMEKSPRRAFLDIAVDGTILGRIIIRVMDKGNLALNFLHMCAGDMGPSYANSRFLCVDDKGGESENIQMDGYVLGGGTSGKAVLSNVNWNKEKRRKIYKTTPYVAGQVRGYFSYHSVSRFDIVTRDGPNNVDKDCFGMVEEGLDVLKDAIWRYPDISRVTIANCGLMICL